MESEAKSKAYWDKIISTYGTPSTVKSILQVVNTVVPFVITSYLMYLSLEYSYFLTLALSVIAGGLVIRFFVIQHDCGHGSFFSKKKANDILGRVLSAITMTPYAQWAKEHNMHHATSGSLDNRGVGDVTTMTVKEYKSSSKIGKIWYRIYRNPFFLFTVGAFAHFIVKQRIPFYKTKKLSSWISVMSTNIYMIAVVVSLSLWIGFVPLMKMYIPVVILASSIGTWLFYLQHQYEDTYWEKGHDWNYYEAAIKGSSFYNLPRILHWFSGNIGYHHIHHLSSKIPNYNLPRCYAENQILQTWPVKMNIIESFKCMRMALWDEDNKKMISFKDL